MTVIVPTAVAPGFDEDAARAGLYGVLAHLFHAPPSAALLAQLGATPAASDGVLAPAWNALAASARDLDAAAVRAEYDALFGGVGKPEVYLFGSYYLAGFLNEKPVARLREDLAALGLARDPAMPETEDHIACLCEVMRCLIVGAGAAPAALATQRTFFAMHIQPWVDALCDTIGAHPAARFYARAADFTRVFASVEAQGFDMLP